MLRNVEISARQFMILVVFFTIGNTFIDQPGEITLWVGRDGWISIILATILALVMVWCWLALQKRLGGMNLIQANEIFFGKIGGKIVSVFFFLYFFLNFIYTCYIFTDFTVLNLLPGASRLMMGVLFVLVVLFSVRKGIGNVVRVAELAFPMVILFLLILFVFVLSRADFHFLQPILSNGWYPVSIGVAESLSSPFFELVTLLLIYTCVPVDQKPARYFYVGVIIGGIILVVLTLLSIAVLGVGQVSESLYPSFTLAKTINLGEFMNRVESIVSTSWLISQVIYGAISFHAACYTFATIFNVTTYRFLTYPLALIALVYAPYLIERRMIFNLDFWFPYSSIFALFFPLILWIAVLIRKKKSDSMSI